MQKAVNTFTDGMDKDTSKEFRKPSSYYHGENIRIQAQGEDSSYSVTNLKGTKFSFFIPETKSLWKINKGSDTIGVWSSYMNISLANGTTVNIPLGRSARDTNDCITSLYELLKDNVTYTSQGFQVYQKNDNAFIITNTISSITDITNFSQYYSPEELVTTIVDHVVIGSTNIRDDIYLFTTDKNSLGSGQIWLLEYNPNGDTTTITLKYNNALNFSTNYLIANSGTLGRYEQNDIQHLYWTDNNNYLRTINIVDPNAFAIEPEDLSVKKSNSLTTPFIQDFISGDLDTGFYQLGYVLKTNNGAKSPLSPLSMIVPLNEQINALSSASDQWSFKTVPEVAVTTTQGLKFKINDLDLGYDTYVAYLFYRNRYDQLARVFSIEKPIPILGVDEITISTLSTLIEVNVSTITVDDTLFDVCKTIASKNDFLFVANTRNSSYEVNYDPRAYRFNAGGESYTYNGVDRITTSNWSEIPEDADCINPSNKDWDDAILDPYIYQSDLTTVGGEGPNVKYKFVQLKKDVTHNYPFTPDAGSFAKPVASIYGGESTEFFDGKPLFYGNTQSNYNNPFISFTLKAHQKGETYRYGFMVTDKAGRKSFVKWIADIKIPETFNSPNNVNLDLDYTASQNLTNINNTGIEFTLNISSIKSTISNVYICRVKRENRDKTILGQGIVEELLMNSAGDKLYLNDNEKNNIYGSSTSYYDFNTSDSLTYSKNWYSFQSPDFLFNGTPAWQTNDRIRFSGILSIPTVQSTWFVSGMPLPLNSMYGDLSPTTRPNTKVSKLYNIDTNPSNAKLTSGNLKNVNIENTLEVFDSPTPLGYTIASKTFYNTTGSGTPNETKPSSRGAKTTILQLSNELKNLVTLQNVDNYLHYIVNYVRPNDSQYGGDTYFYRTKNTYEPVSYFNINDDTDSEITIKAFSGDTYTTLFDNVKYIENWTPGFAAAGGGYGSDDDKRGHVWIFPVETSVNTNARIGNTFVRNDITAEATGVITGGEEYLVNPTYQVTNDIVLLFPKPFNFDAVSAEENDNRIWFSEKKINGEISDSWTVFKSSNSYDIEGLYGPINALKVLNDSLYFIQDRAVGLLSVNERVVITDGTALVLGSGTTINRHDYIATTCGSKHQHSVTTSNNSLYFYDTLKYKMYKITPSEGLSPITDMLGLHNYLLNTYNNEIHNTDNPYIAGVTSTFDHINDEVLFTFISTSKKETICFNQKLNKFTSFYSASPYLYINNTNVLFSPANKTKSIYIHNKGKYGDTYGVQKPSKITIVVNDHAASTKVFDNLFLDMDTLQGTQPVTSKFDYSRFRTFTQDTGLMSTTDITKSKERTVHMIVPRNNGSSDRLRDKYLTVDLEFTNDVSNKNFILYNIQTLYRVSAR